jgi:sortase A
MVEDETLRPENFTEIQLPPEVPVRILIPSINLDAPVIPAPVNFEKLAGKEFMQWLVPDQYASGWHTTSAMLGETGNTVLNGHHNAFGEVFISLIDANIGDIIWVDAENSRFSYQITNKIIVPEKYEQLDVRMNNAQWILPTIDERLTLITCWPYETNTHRLIVVARPLGREVITHSYK